MKGSTHMGLSIVTGMMVQHFHELPLFYSFTFDPFFYGGLLLGSLLPDIDHPQSSISRLLFGVGSIFHRIFGHRGFTHSLLACLILWGLIQSIHVSFSIGFCLGYLSHLLGDFFTNRGVPLLHPLSKKRWRAPLTFKTGSRVESLVMTLLSLAIFALLYFMVLDIV